MEEKEEPAETRWNLSFFKRSLGNYLHSAESAL